MPDQNSAADEHALLEEITAPLSALPEDPVPIAADVDFPVVLRGYDRVAVDAYVRRTSQLVAELQATRSPEAAVRRALERVGQQISGILKRAHETSAQITSQSRSEAEDRLEVARREAERLTGEAEARVRELDAETDRIWAERQRIVDDARQLSQDLMTLAAGAAERFPAASGDTGETPPSETLGVESVGAAPEPELGTEPELGATQVEGPFDVEDPASASAAGVPGGHELLEDEEATAHPGGEEPVPGEPAASEPAVEEPSALEQPGLGQPPVDEPLLPATEAAEPDIERPILDDPTSAEPAGAGETLEHELPRPVPAERPAERAEPVDEVDEDPDPTIAFSPLSEAGRADSRQRPESPRRP